MGFFMGARRQLAANFVEPVGRGNIIYARTESYEREERKKTRRRAPAGGHWTQPKTWPGVKKSIICGLIAIADHAILVALLRKDRKRMSCMQSPINYEYELVPRGKIGILSNLAVSMGWWKHFPETASFKQPTVNSTPQDVFFSAHVYAWSGGN